MPRAGYVLSGYLQATSAFLTAFCCSLEQESCSSKPSPDEEGCPDLSDVFISNSSASGSRSILFGGKTVAQLIDLLYSPGGLKMKVPLTFGGRETVKQAEVLDVRNDP